MAFPTVTVTPGTGQTVNTLPNAGQNTSANSLGVVIASDQYTATAPLYIADANTAPAAVTWTSGTSVNTANTVPVAGYDGLVISIVAGPSITGGVLIFEAYDGAAWVSQQVGQVNTYGAVTQVTLTANMSQGYQVNTAGFTQFRTRIGTAITGTGNVVVTHITTSANVPDPLTVGIDPATTVAVKAAAGTYTDGWDITQGTKADTAWTTGSGSVVSVLKAIDRDINLPLPGAVTTAVPSYTSGTTNYISLTTLGSLRNDLSSYNGTQLTGTVTAYGTTPTGNVFGVNAYITNTPAVTISSGTVTTVSTVTNLGTIASNTPLYAGANGSTNKAAGITIGTAVSQVDQSGTAFAGSGSVLGTVVASTQGGGGVVSAEINVSALTLGTATAVFAILQESRGGTNFTDIWVSDPITVTGIISMPAIPVAGRRRWRFFSAGGTSTTVTVTITTLELPTGSYPLQRQFRDYYAATNPLALMFNSAALTASNFVLGTLSTATTPFHIEGAKQLSAFMVLAGSPTVTTQPVVTVQVSPDGTNWMSVPASTLTAAGNGLYMVMGANITAKFARLIVTTAAAYSAGSYTISNIGINAVN